MSKRSPILIINFDFPPNSGIGGRRWGKIASQLAKDGFDVHVIKADPIGDGKVSNWANDVQVENVHVYSLPRTYPQAMLAERTGFWSRLRYKWAKEKLERTHPGTIYDISIGWDKVLLPKAIEIIHRFGIKNVLATGAPWNMLYFTAQLKSRFSDLHIVVDYRDPWLTAKNYGMPNLNETRRAEETRKQAFVLENADIVTSPYPWLTQELRDFASEKGLRLNRYEVITHFYDPTDFVQPMIHQKNDKIKLVYGGDLYIGLEPEIKRINAWLDHLKQENLTLYSRLDIQFFASNPKPNWFANHPVVTMNGNIGKRIFHEVANADYLLILLSDHKRHDLTTKFFDYMPYRRPFLVVANDGYVTSFVEKHQLGLVLRNANDLEKALSHPFDLKALDGFDISPYALPNIAKQLAGYLK